MGDTGLYEKYSVTKGGEPVESCFVLEPENDPAAREALLAYAEATENESLAADLRQWVERSANGEQSDSGREKSP